MAQSHCRNHDASRNGRRTSHQRARHALDTYILQTRNGTAAMVSHQRIHKIKFLTLCTALGLTRDTRRLAISLLLAMVHTALDRLHRRPSPPDPRHHGSCPRIHRPRRDDGRKPLRRAGARPLPRISPAPDGDAARLLRAAGQRCRDAVLGAGAAFLWRRVIGCMRICDDRRRLV